MEKNIKGKIVRIESKNYYVLNEHEKVIRCFLRGKFQKEFGLKKDKLYKLDIAAVGDYVDFEINKDDSGVIEKIHDRKNYLSRKAPKIKGASYRGERLEQIVAANIDNLFVVTSIKNPHFNNRLVDRIITAAESSHITPHLIINKIDLDDKNTAELWRKLYSEIGYNVFLSSVIKPSESQYEIKETMKDKVNIFWGHSGVGKTSLLNFFYPNLNLKVDEVSSNSKKGKHTTVTVRMEKVEEKTFIIDTPGIREIDPYGISRENLSHYFVEFIPFINECKFNTCTHYHEPDCSIVDAVMKSKISTERYESYLNMLDSIEDDLHF